MELIAKKVSNLSGDIRAAFDIFKTILTQTQTRLLKKEFDEKVESGEEFYFISLKDIVLTIN